MDEVLRSWIRSMPKAELHVHLEGTIGPETLLRLARKHGRIDDLPGDSVEALRGWMTFTNFPDFITRYLLITSLLRDEDDFTDIVVACGDDMASQGILYREITVTPYLHTHVANKGLSIDHVLNGLEEGRRQAKETHGVEMRWVFDIPRNASFDDDNVDSYNPQPAELTCDYAIYAMDRGCIGFGLGGDEVGAPPEYFAHAFERAISAGLHSLPHAGETVGPSSVWGAINELQAERIGHGVRAIEDPELLVVLRDRQIPLEVNPTSNLRLHVYPSLEAHPFVHLDRMGLYLTINSDDPPLFNTTLVDEYLLAHEIYGYGRQDLARFARQAFQVIVADDATKETLLSQLDAWRLEQAEMEHEL